MKKKREIESKIDSMSMYMYSKFTVDFWFVSFAFFLFNMNND